MPAWGRAVGSTLSIFTTRAGRAVRFRWSPATPVSGATGSGTPVVVVGATVVVVGTAGVGAASSSPPPPVTARATPARTSTARTAPITFRFLCLSRVVAGQGRHPPGPRLAAILSTAGTGQNRERGDEVTGGGVS